MIANNVREDNVAAMKDKRFLDQLAKKYRQINREQAGITPNRRRR